MEKWLRDLYGIPDPPALWVPTYQAPQTITSENGVTAPINLQYLLSKESALHLASLFQAAVIEKPFGGGGGPNTTSAVEYHLKWPDGLEINAGFLAYYFKPADKNPAQATIDNPDLALQQCRALINIERMRKQQ